MIDMFETGADLLVNPVNTQGVMGKGVAYQFKLKFPQMFQAYKEACHKGHIKTGRVWFYLNTDPQICCFPTKDNWKNRSQLIWIDGGMQDLVRKLNNDFAPKVKTIAFPKLGCGLGGLQWEHVEAVMLKNLRELDSRFEYTIC